MPSEPPDDGAEPDYRFTLANERTFLAWIRTALALLAGGIALDEVASSFASESTRTVLAIMAVALSLVLAVSSFVRWRQVQSAIQRDAPLPHPWAVPVLATGVVTVSGIVALMLVFR